jgi:hypothetical protein
MNKLKKPSALVPAASSFVVVCMLMIVPNGKPQNDILEAIGAIALLVLASCAIASWIKYVRDYVDFAIEQKFNPYNKEAED